MRRLMIALIEHHVILVRVLLICALVGACSPPVSRITLAPTLTPSPQPEQPKTPTRRPSATPTAAATPSRIPTPSPSATAHTYVVRKGDILGRISQDLGVAVQALIEANGLENPNQLSIGQVLIIPPPAATADSHHNTSATPLPTSTPRPTVSPTPVDRVVYITGADAEYHLEGCEKLGDRGIPITCREAVQLGYRACRLCNPRCW
jgi:LysM repeat protein